MYRINQKLIIDEYGKEWSSFGITCGDIVIKDISTDREKIQKLVDLCNELELAPSHLYDIIDDFLVDYEI